MTFIYMNWFTIQLNYMLCVTPCILAATTNIIVLLTFKKSSRLQDHPLPFRQDISFSFVLGSLAYLGADIALTFVPQLKASLSICKGASYLIFVAVGAVKVTAVVSVLCRYLAVCCPYNRFALLLLNRENVNVIIWPVVVVFNLPQAFIHEVYNFEEEFFCGRPGDSLAYQIFLALFYGIPLTGYFVATHLLVRVVDLQNEGDQAPNSYNRILRQGAVLVRAFIIAYVLLFIPLIALDTLEIGLDESLHAFTMYCSPLCILLSFVEPVCYALPDETFRDELRLHLGLGLKVHQQPQHLPTADPTTNSPSSHHPAILTLN